MNHWNKFVEFLLKVFDQKKRFEGKDIKEVWDFRLSEGCPYLYCDGPFWIIRIWPNTQDGVVKKILAEYITDIPANGNPHDYKAVARCYELLYAVRDDFAKPNINDLKPEVRRINKANQDAAQKIRFNI